MFAALIALLVGRGIASWLASFIVYGVVTVLLVGGTATAWHLLVAKPYYVRGVADGKAEQAKADKPVIDKLTQERDEARTDRDNALAANATLASSVDTLTAKLADANANIAQLQTLAERARQQARKAIAEIQARVKRDADEIARLTAIANGPPVADACAKADEYLTQLALWWRAQP